MAKTTVAPDKEMRKMEKMLLSSEFASARFLAAKLKIENDSEYQAILKGSKLSFEKYFEAHYLHNALETYDLTGSLPAALTVLYHFAEKDGVDGIRFSHALEEYEGDVKRNLSNYYMLKIGTNLYKSDELRNYLGNIVIHPTQYLARVCDMVNSLSLTQSRDIRMISATGKHIVHGGTPKVDIIDRETIAMSLMEDHSKIIHTMGYHSLDVKLRDTVFSITDPEIYHFLSARLPQPKIANKLVKYGKEMIELALRDNEMDGYILGRTKSVWSMYNKFKKYRLDPISDIDKMKTFNDVLAFMVVLTGTHNSVPAVYSAQEMLEAQQFFRYCRKDEVYDPENTIDFSNGKAVKDYIKKPKDKYESLHLFLKARAFDAECGKIAKTALFFEDGREPGVVEVQVRSADMHEVNEHGAAWHGRIKGVEMTVKDFVDSVVSCVHDKKKITRKIGIKVIGQGEGKRETAEIHAHTETFDRQQLVTNISTVIRSMYGEPRIEGLRIPDNAMDRIFDSKEAQIVVNVDFDANRKKVTMRTDPKVNVG